MGRLDVKGPRLVPERRRRSSAHGGASPRRRGGGKREPDPRLRRPGPGPGAPSPWHRRGAGDGREIQQGAATGGRGTGRGPGGVGGRSHIGPVGLGRVGFWTELGACRSNCFFRVQGLNRDSVYGLSGSEVAKWRGRGGRVGRRDGRLRAFRAIAPALPFRGALGPWWSGRQMVKGRYEYFSHRD